MCHNEHNDIDGDDTMRRVLVCGLFGILFAGTAVNGLDKITNAIQKFKGSKVGQAVNQFTQTQAFQAIKQVAITVILPKVKEKISSMKTAVTSKNAEVINSLNSSQAGLVSNANILSQSGNPTVINAVNSANASAGQMLGQITPLINNTIILTNNAQPIAVNLDNIKSMVNLYINNMNTHVNNIEAQKAIIQNNMGTLDATQQAAANMYILYLTQLTNLSKASVYASGISAYIDQIINQAQAHNVTKDNLKLWVSELAAYGSAFQQSLNAGGISFDAKIAALITGSDLVTVLATNGIDMQQTNMLTPPATQQMVVQPVVQQSQPVQRTPAQHAATVTRASRRR